MSIHSVTQLQETFDDQTEEFDHIPQLPELVQHGGTPGYVYAQICTHNLRKARKDGYSLVNRDVYLISSPKGQAEMILMVKGEANNLLSPYSGARLCLVDLEVETLTGFVVKKQKPVVEPTVAKKPPQVAKLELGVESNG